MTTPQLTITYWGVPETWKRKVPVPPKFGAVLAIVRKVLGMRDTLEARARYLAGAMRSRDVTPKAYRAYRAKLEQLFRDFAGQYPEPNPFPLTGPVELSWIAVFPCAKDLPKARARRIDWYPKHRGDRDNLEKAIGDAGNEILWEDDRQVVAGPSCKIRGTYWDTPRLVIRVRSLVGTDPMDWPIVRELGGYREPAGALFEPTLPKEH